MKDVVIELLRRRGVSLDAIAEVVFDSQRAHLPGVTFNECRESVDKVVSKREAQYAIMTGIALDMLAEEDDHLLPPALAEAVRSDDPLFGVDEILALGITNLYGSIGLTTFGYLDKRKPGVIATVNSGTKDRVHTFLDDLIAGIAAAAGARLVHEHFPAGDEDNS